jgi:hypothetical protein
MRARGFGGASKNTRNEDIRAFGRARDHSSSYSFSLGQRLGLRSNGRQQWRRLPAKKPRRMPCRRLKRRRGSALRAPCRRRQTRWVICRNSNRPVLRSVRRCPGRGRQRSLPQNPLKIRRLRHQVCQTPSRGRYSRRSPLRRQSRRLNPRRLNRHPPSRAKRPTFRQSTTRRHNLLILEDRFAPSMATAFSGRSHKF